MRIGELAAQTGASPRALRYYEQKGLLKSTRAYNDYRDYGVESVPRVRQIRDLLASGLGVRAIKRILPCLDSTDSIEFDDIAPDTKAMLESERDALSARITCLTTSRDAIADYLDRLSRRQGQPRAATSVPRETLLARSIAADGGAPVDAEPNYLRAGNDDASGPDSKVSNTILV